MPANTPPCSACFDNSIILIKMARIKVSTFETVPKNSQSCWVTLMPFEPRERKLERTETSTEVLKVDVA